jgi:hypothetical protein
MPRLAIEKDVDVGEYVGVGEASCVRCNALTRIKIHRHYRDNKLVDIDDPVFPKGWRYLPYGPAGGKAPYCPNCKPEDKP